MRSFMSVTACLLLVASPSAAEELTIATWNMSWLTGTLNSGNHPRDDDDFDVLAKYAQRLDADVIALQEISDEDGLSKVFGADYTFHLAGHPSSQRTGFAVRTGVSFTPLPDFEELVTSQGLRSGAQIEIDLEAQALRLMSVHLKSGCFAEEQDNENRKDSERTARVIDACKKLYRQIPDLEDWINEVALETDAYAIIGDFNRRFTDDDGDWIHSELQNEPGEPDGAGVSSLMAGREPGCWPEFTEYIDHFMVNGAVGGAVAQGSFTELIYEERDRKKVSFGGRTVRYPSDHCPLKVTLGF